MHNINDSDHPRYVVGACSYKANSSDMETLAVKSSTVQQHTKNLRNWLQQRKKREDSIDVFELEQQLSRKDGESAGTFVNRWSGVYRSLHRFYNRKSVKLKRWKAKQGYKSELQKIHHALFKMLGGDSTHKGEVNHNRFIFLGNAGFGTGKGLHTVMEKGLVKKARSLGYRVLVVDEYYSSQKCCRCGGQCEAIGMRVKHCSSCDIYFHRDLLAAENMCRIGESGLRGLDRPKDLKKPSSIITEKRLGTAVITTNRTVRAFIVLSPLIYHL